MEPLEEDVPGVPPIRERVVTTTTAAPEKTFTSPDPDLYLPIYIVSGVFAAIFVIGPIIATIRKGPYVGIIRTSIMLAAFSMWLFWVTVYIAQMNPLVGPRLDNWTLAWIAHSWGKPVDTSLLEEDSDDTDHDEYSNRL